MRNLIFYGSYYEAIKELPDKEQGLVYKAIIDYAMEKVEPSLSGISKAIFTLIKPTLDSSIKNYENGKRGGRPSKESQTETEEQTQDKTQIETETITQTQTETTTQDKTQAQSDIIFENEKEKEIENEKEIEKENSLARVKESEGLSLPTRTQKHKYGKYKNVLLTEAEYNRLMSEPDGEDAIEFYSENREIKGYKSKNDNLAIRKWAFDAVKERRIKKDRLNGTLPQQGAKKESPIEQLGRVLGGG